MYSTDRYFLVNVIGWDVMTQVREQVTSLLPTQRHQPRRPSYKTMCSTRSVAAFHRRKTGPIKTPMTSFTVQTYRR